MFLIVDREGRPVSLTPHPPSTIDLASRGERVLAEDELSDVQRLTVASIGRVTPEMILAGQKRVALSTSAKDADGDGIAEIPADGKSAATFSVKVLEASGKTVRKDLTLRLRTTGGTLSARTITTSMGAATFSLTSCLETVVVTVSVEAPGAAPASLSLEFVPVVATSKAKKAAATAEK